MKYIFDECKLHFIQERYSIMGIILQTNENAIMLEQKSYKKITYVAFSGCNI